MVWEQCKFRGYWNRAEIISKIPNVWEQCKFRGYWNLLLFGRWKCRFESSVNSEGIETKNASFDWVRWFESSVNSEGIETASTRACIYTTVWEQCKFRGYWNCENGRYKSWLFESSVNSEGIETLYLEIWHLCMFESSVNSEGIETHATVDRHYSKFESSVNSEGIETFTEPINNLGGLRAV